MDPQQQHVARQHGVVDVFAANVAPVVEPRRLHAAVEPVRATDRITAPRRCAPRPGT